MKKLKTENVNRNLSDLELQSTSQKDSEGSPSGNICFEQKQQKKKMMKRQRI